MSGVRDSRTVPVFGGFVADGDILMKCRMSELVWELSVVRVTGSDPRTRRQAETRGSSSG